MMYGWGLDGWGIGGWIAMALLMILFWGGLVTVIVLLVRRTHPDPGTASTLSSRHDAERILNERFARGEIDETDYLARRDALRRPE